jgi:ATP-dependent Clp protease ATP-binding subunit ClpC
MNRLLNRLKQKGTIVELTDSAKEFIAEKGFDEKYGARPLRRALQKYVEDILAEKVLRGDIPDFSKVVLKANETNTDLEVESIESLEIPLPTTELNETNEE